MNNFGEGKWMVGRRDHRCEYCYGLIPQGEEHYHYRGMFDGRWQNWRMHRECWEDYSSQPNNDMLDGFMPGEAPMSERVTRLSSESETKEQQ